VTEPGSLKKMPLFPLNTVLFPGMVLPLHIFEPRYRLMIGRCIQQQQPFGVVLIREGQEVGGGANPHDIGTTAYITHSERQPDGRLNIHTVGYQRFRIHQMEQREPYLVGMVEDFPVEGEQDSRIPELVRILQPVLKRYLSGLTDAAGMEVDLEEIPDDGLALAYFVAIAVPLPMDEKQKILATPSLADMLTLEHHMLRRELALLAHMVRRDETVNEQPDMLFSTN
jgi:uncharacterized protein